MESILQILKEALEEKIAYTPDGESVSLLLSNNAAKDLLEALKDVTNREDDGK